MANTVRAAYLRPSSPCCSPTGADRAFCSRDVVIRMPCCLALQRIPAHATLPVLCRRICVEARTSKHFLLARGHARARDPTCRALRGRPRTVSIFVRCRLAARRREVRWATGARRRRMKGRRRPPLPMCPLQMVLPRRPYPLRSPSPRPRPASASASRPPSSPRSPSACTRPHRLTARVPHPYRADRPIKKKPPGRRNPPANEAVTKWLIIETLERASLEEILQFAFCVCDA